MKKLNLVIRTYSKAQLERLNAESGPKETLDKGITIDARPEEPDPMTEWDKKKQQEAINELKNPKDPNFERRLEELDRKLETIKDPKQADILILKTLGFIEAEEDSQCRRQLFNYLTVGG